jgi:hypothetical protein
VLNRIRSLITLVLLSGLLWPVMDAAGAQTPQPSWMKGTISMLEKELVARYGEQQHERVRRGLEQTAAFWREEDGGTEVFEKFVRAHFAGDLETLDTVFGRFELLLEKLNGHMHEIRIEFRRQIDLDRGPVLPVDGMFAAYNPSAHIIDDFFKNKLAFVVLLNFPLTTLDECLTEGQTWSRRQWAEARLAQLFSKRIPSEVNLAVTVAASEADRYITDYNIWMHHLIGADGERLFPPGMKLLSHWNLRDEIKANYGQGEEGLAKQRMVERVMERIVDQTIPEVVVDNPHVDWNPFTNEVKTAAAADSDIPAPPGMEITGDAEPDTRYAHWLNCYKAAKLIDPYSPTAPTHIARRFDEDREIPEERVREMLEMVASSPLVAEVAKVIEKRLGRPLEPFDIWYNGFQPKSDYSEEELDEIVAAKYPTAEAYRKDIPNMLRKLGFTERRAALLADHILVEPARGSGHASGAEMREAKARLRTRVGSGGMDYKGYNIAVHEMGHNVEQVISLNDVDHYFLEGVPNTAFTEAFAFVFQSRDLDLLGLEISRDEESENMKLLHDFWQTCEIACVSLVDMAAWHWMYDHPDAAPAELKRAVIEIARGVWNRYYTPVFGKRDVTLLAIYSHMVDGFLYLPDYPIGHLIAVQIEEQVERAGNVGSEFERMARFGNIAPDLWMKQATGAPVGAEALLEATEKALRAVSQ